MPLAVLGMVLAGYRRFLDNPFFGSDTWPWLASSRVGSLGELARLAVSPIMPGTRFAVEVARFYHPLTSLSYAFDVSLFGLSPPALYATNLAIHLCAVAGVYALARAMGASVWAAGAGAVVLGLHPISAATVPSLPRRQDLVVGALLVWSMYCLARARVDQAPPRWGYLVLAQGLFFLALGGKEIAYAGLAVVPMVVACGRSPSAGGPEGRRAGLTRALVVVAAFGLLGAVGFAIRWRVLGGLGGYYGSERFFGAFSGVLEYFVRPYVTLMLWPAHALMPDRLRDWLLMVGAGGVVLAFGVISLPVRVRRLALLGLGWQVPFLGLYVVFHTSLSAYLLYVPLIGLALLVAALVEGGWPRGLAFGGARSGRLGRLGAGVSAVLAAVVLLGVLRTSVLVRRYPEWEAAGFVSNAFWQQALPCISAAPAGAPISVDGLPHRVDDGSDEARFVDAFIFEPYSLDDGLRVLASGTHARIDAASVQDVGWQPMGVSVTCGPGPDGWRLQTVVAG